MLYKKYKMLDSGQHLGKSKLSSTKMNDFGVQFPRLGQVLSRVTRKVLSNSKHTLLCLYGHNVLARINLIPLKTLRRFAQWLEAQSLQGTAHFLYAK